MYFDSRDKKSTTHTKHRTWVRHAAVPFLAYVHSCLPYVHAVHGYHDFCDPLNAGVMHYPVLKQVAKMYLCTGLTSLVALVVLYWQEVSHDEGGTRSIVSTCFKAFGLEPLTCDGYLFE